MTDNVIQFVPWHPEGREAYLASEEAKNKRRKDALDKLAADTAPSEYTAPTDDCA